MTRYKQADFEDDSSSVGSVQLREGVSANTTHIRYHTGTTLWKARTLLEKCLLVLTVTLLIAVLVLGLLLSTTERGEPALQVLHVGPHTADKQYCLTVPCVTAAASMLSSLDMSVNPCEDFYQYSCGGWVRSNPIPDGKSMWGTFGKLEQQNQLVVKNVLEKPFVELKSKSEEKAKMYYLSCMDANETIESLGAKPMLNLLKKVGGWNISAVGGKPFNVSVWDLQNTIQTLQNRYNMGGLFSWAVGEDDRNSSRHVIQIDQGGLTLPTRDNYLNKTANEKILAAYLDYMTKVPTSLYAATSCGMKFCGTGTLFYKSGVHKLSKIIGARMVPRSRFHTKDPQILCATKQNIVLQATWRPELVHLCHKSNVMNK